jgi:hypothetical protein
VVVTEDVRGGKPTALKRFMVAQSLQAHTTVQFIHASFIYQKQSHLFPALQVLSLQHLH